MKKEQFLRELGLRLSSLPYADKKRSLDYYSEMIADRMEDGLAEEEAVKKMGTPAFAAEKILFDKFGIIHFFKIRLSVIIIAFYFGRSTDNAQGRGTGDSINRIAELFYIRIILIQIVRLS